MRPHPLDVAAVGSRASQAKPDHVHEQAGDPQQVHGISDECGGDNVVDEEGAVIWQKDTPAETQWFSVSGNNRQTVERKTKHNSLKSDFSISQELPVKEPAEENIQTENHRQKRFSRGQRSVRFHTLYSHKICYLLRPRDGSNRTMKIRKV